ncbi:hypothetical protein GC098_37150 [Paenibacillus sp. LMG 31458]|uniref:Pre-toxin TG domain-containing protein n=1 Tax=Paenibacillus phytorum TaxID=2654977 RepID=A0ABX1Y7S3_9BACL|nr:hypothetical protein [Paenibacillus phytorum]NOU76927.1 hypothetical protein [Paenibacillus phytorum]
MAKGNHFQPRPSAIANQHANQSQMSQRSSAAPQAFPLAPNFFIQMQRTAGNRATQAYTNQLIQRNTPASPLLVVPTAAPAATAAQTVAPTPAAAATQTAAPTPAATQAAAPAAAASASGMSKETADMTAGVTSTFSDSFGARSDNLKDSFDKTDNASDAQQSASMGAVASAADLIGGPFQILSTIRETLAISSADRTKGDYASAGLAITESGGKMVSGSAGLVDKAAKSTGHKDGVGGSSSVSDYSGTVAEAISAVKSTIMTVKGIYDMYSKFSEKDTGEKAKGVIDVISNAIQGAQSGLKVAKGIMEIMETSTASLTSVIPGVSIAVSGVKIAIKTVDVIKAGLNRSAMTALKRDFKGKAENAAFVKAKTWYRNAGVDKAKLAAHKLTLETKSAQGDAAARSQLEAIKNYELAKEMKNINVKRTTRGGLQIGLELTKIAADIATLTGVGAQVGTPLKIVASGVGAAMPIVRSLKQAGRDRAAKDGAWGITKAVFDANKSTEKKRERRSRDADLILDLIRSLPEIYDPVPAAAPATAAPAAGSAPAAATPAPAPVARSFTGGGHTDSEVITRYKQVCSFIEAAGVNWPTLKGLENDPDKLREGLITAMGQRE